MTNYDVELSNYINRNKDELLHQIQKAVQIKSVVGHEQAMQRFMKERYLELGLDVTEFEPNYKKMKKHEAFVDSGFPFEGRTNIVGIFNGKSSAPSLTLHGHVDVVSSEPVQKWTKDPWGGEIVNNRLYGRGSADMKGGLIANWFALKAILDIGLEPEGTVQLHSVIEEEAGGGGGALACLEEGFITDGFLSTEPHALQVTVAHAGILYFRVKVFGRTAHAGLAHLGINAISKMYKIINALEILNRKRAKEIQYKLFNMGSGQSVHLNIGTFHAGDWVSSVAGEAIIECRIGFIPGESRSHIKQLIVDTLYDASRNDDWFVEHPPEIEWFGWSTEPWYQDEKHLYVQSFINSASRTLNKEIKIIGRASGNDARFTQYYSKPGICFGPKGGNIHGPDEYLEIDSIIDTTKVLSSHIMNWTKSSQ